MTTNLADSDLSDWDEERVASRRGAKLHPGKWLIGFAVFACIFQFALYFLGNIAAVRMPLRVAAFASSISYLWFVRDGIRGAVHPAARIVPWILGVLCIGILLPGGGLLAAVAQASLYAAVLVPLIWSSYFDVDRTTLRRIVLVFWAFYTSSAALGVLQVKYPGQYDGAISSSVDNSLVTALSYKTTDGTLITRPKGLSDAPGGAGAHGVYAIILGLGLLLTDRDLIIRLLSIASMVASLFSIYLSHGRTNLIIVGFSVLFLIVVLIRRGEGVRVGSLLAILIPVTVLGTTLAFAVGGDATLDRWTTLIEDDPTTVAYNNRGSFLDEVINEDIYKYPIGAGGGRWGMMNVYFGEPSESLWAEMMWQAVVYDGGIPLMLLYIVLLITLVAVAWHYAVRVESSDLAGWWSVMLGLNFASITATFVFPIFVKETGMQIILLNACLYVVSNRRSKNNESVKHELNFEEAEDPQVSVMADAH